MGLSKRIALKPTEKRYIAKISAFVWAESDEDAMEISLKLAELLRSFDDNWASVDELINENGENVK